MCYKSARSRRCNKNGSLTSKSQENRPITKSKTRAILVCTGPVSCSMGVSKTHNTVKWKKMSGILISAAAMLQPTLKNGAHGETHTNVANPLSFTMSKLECLLYAINIHVLNIFAKANEPTSLVLYSGDRLRDKGPSLPYSYLSNKRPYQINDPLDIFIEN